MNPLFSGKSSVRQLNDSELTTWIDLNKKLWEDIMDGKVLSWRHKIQVEGPPNKRQRLKLEPIAILKSDQFHTVSMHLTEMFVKKDMKMFSYVNSVLVPEAIVYLVMEFYSIGYTKAEKKMREPYHDNMEISSDEEPLSNSAGVSEMVTTKPLSYSAGASEMVNTEPLSYSAGASEMVGNQTDSGHEENTGKSSSYSTM